MKPAEEIAKQAYRKIEERCVTCQADECREAGEQIIQEVIEAVRKKCAEVVRTWADDHLTIQPSFTKIAKAIEEMEL